MATAAKVLTLCEELLYFPLMKNALTKTTKTKKPQNIDFNEILYVFSTLNRSIWHSLINPFILYTHLS